MLSVAEMKKQIKAMFEQALYTASVVSTKSTYPQQSSTGDAIAETKAHTFMDLAADPMAEIIAEMINSALQNITLEGTIVTTGTAASQTANIKASLNPSLNGKIPNSLGPSE